LVQAQHDRIVTLGAAGRALALVRFNRPFRMVIVAEGVARFSPDEPPRGTMSSRAEMEVEALALLIGVAARGLAAGHGDDRLGAFTWPDSGDPDRVAADRWIMLSVRVAHRTDPGHEPDTAGEAGWATFVNEVAHLRAHLEHDAIDFVDENANVIRELSAVLAARGQLSYGEVCAALQYLEGPDMDDRSDPC
jgi:hypothetical protein